MTSRQQTTPESFILPNGMEIDLNDAWRKLISSQFTGSAGRGFRELIQNFLDSYTSSTPWDERKGVIKSGKKWISITDYGEGMGRERLELLLTLGGTDKSQNKNKIGTFGIGFFSIFNPKLTTRKVIVTTLCEDQVVEMVFMVNKPEERPEIKCRILDKKISYSTCIKIVFSNQHPVELCLNHAERCLQYYPCKVSINGKPHSSVWQQATAANARMFSSKSCDGFLWDHGCNGHLNLLCKYEYLMPISVNSLITGGHSMKYNLHDYRRRSMPYLNSVSGTVNSNRLNVTISRDSFRMDYAYSSLVTGLAEAMGEELVDQLEQGWDKGLVIANQFVLCAELKKYITGLLNKDEDQEENKLFFLLAKYKVYRINGHRELYSLLELAVKKSADLPLFYSPCQTNLRWLGGNFSHDFIVLPPQCGTGNGAPDLYDMIFKTIFTNVVNLDTIRDHNDRLQQLVESGIVDKETLSPRIRFHGERELTPKEYKLLNELEDFFKRPTIQNAISRNLYIPVQDIRAVFFDVQDQKAVIATGLFDGEGKALSETSHCNLEPLDDEENPTTKNNRKTICLGLHRNNELIRTIIDNRDPHRLYFALPILAHELALCQKLLVPYSPGYHLIKERLAGDMRRALMEDLLPMAKAA